MSFNPAAPEFTPLASSFNLNAREFTPLVETSIEAPKPPNPNAPEFTPICSTPVTTAAPDVSKDVSPSQLELSVKVNVDLRKQNREKQTRTENPVKASPASSVAAASSKSDLEEYRPSINRVLTGGIEKKKPTPEELEAKMEKIRLKNVEILKRQQEAEADQLEFEEMQRQLEMRNEQARKAREAFDELQREREENAKLKLSNRGTREWDKAKDEVMLEKLKENRYSRLGRDGRKMNSKDCEFIAVDARKGTTLVEESIPVSSTNCDNALGFSVPHVAVVQIAQSEHFKGAGNSGNEWGNDPVENETVAKASAVDESEEEDEWGLPPVTIKNTRKADLPITSLKSMQVSSGDNNAGLNERGSDAQYGIDSAVAVVAVTKTEPNYNAMKFTSPETGERNGCFSKWDSVHSYNRPVDWTCASCNRSNFARNQQCFGCKASKRINTNPADTFRTPQSRPGDWICSSCQKNNFARNAECYRCKAGKPANENTASITGVPSRDHFKPLGQSWTCSNCDGNNYSYRYYCFKCKEPKFKMTMPSAGHLTSREDSAIGELDAKTDVLDSRSRKYEGSRKHTDPVGYPTVKAAVDSSVALVGAPGNEEVEWARK